MLLEKSVEKNVRNIIRFYEYYPVYTEKSHSSVLNLFQYDVGQQVNLTMK